MDTQALEKFINSGGQERLDSAATQHVARELELIRSKTYDVLYSPSKARKFIPASPDRDPAADSIVYYQWDEYGAAKIVTNYAKDFPLVDVLRKEFRVPVKSLGAAYEYSLQDLRRAAKAGSRLDERKPRAARAAIERSVDDIAAFGRAEAGMNGFVDHPNVSVATLPNGGAWKSGSALVTAILEDLHGFVADAVAQVGDVEEFFPDTVLLPSEAYHYLAQLFMDTQNTKTVLRAFVDESPYIQNVDFWHKLDNVPGAVGGNRAICYRRHPDVLQLEEPQPFEQFEPEREGLSWKTHCHSRIAGTVITYPVAVLYADNVI